MLLVVRVSDGLGSEVGSTRSVLKLLMAVVVWMYTR